jgi:hypothetical protein
MRGGLALVLVLVSATLAAQLAQAGETQLFHGRYTSPVNGNKVETIPVAAGYDSLRLTVNISAGSGFWSDVRGYASVTLRDPDGDLQFHAFKLAVLPAVWNTGNALNAVPCVLPICVYPGNPFAPYTQEWTVHLAPVEGDWRLAEVHATPGIGIFVTVDLVGITEA